MRKRFLPWMIVAVLAGAAFVLIWLNMAKLDRMQAESEKPVIGRQYDEADKKLSPVDSAVPAAAAPLELKRPIRLAVGSLGLPDDEQNRRLSDLILTELSGAQGLNLVDRQSLEAVLRELNLSLSGLIRAKDALRAGKLLKADWFLLGTQAEINGTNSIVLRLVDARTGIMREAGVFPGNQPSPQLAGDIAAFVRQSRQNAASGKPTVFLAIGSFEDLSVNNRQPGFPTQLQGYLTAAFQNGKVTLLEREYADVLLQEMDLDLAGLTDESATNLPAPMQSAYWVVSGDYQCYQTTNVEVEIALEVQRVFGASKYVTLRGSGGEQINRQVKQAIDTIMAQNQAMIVPSRKNEIRIQLNLGKDTMFSDFSQMDRELVSGGININISTAKSDPRANARWKRNLDEAIRAFDTVLLLDPTNREAKIYLAACFQNPAINRVNEARNYYREIIDAEVQDRWTEAAKRAVVASFRTHYTLGDQNEIARWFASAAGDDASPAAKDFYSKHAEAAKVEAGIEKGDSHEAERVLEERLFEALKSYRDELRSHPASGGTSDMAMYPYATYFGPDPAVGARRLAELLPKVKSQVPEMEPYFLASVVTYQTDTNAPVVAQFQQELPQFREHPESLLAPQRFWENLMWVVNWSLEKKLYGLAAQMLEGTLQLPPKTSVYLNDGHYIEDNKIKLAFAYMGMGRWQPAREIFESLSDQPFTVYNPGPWGPSGTLVFPAKEAEFCGKKLGQNPVLDSREFLVSKACFCLCVPSTFEIDENGIWIGISNQLLHLDFDLKTNLAVTLPKDSETAINSLCITATNVWIGTDLEGLIEYDKTSGQCRRWTEKEGLLMDNISSLNLAGDTLWIGYGHRIGYGTGEEGGLGRLNLSTRQFSSFTVALQDRRGATNKPPNRPVTVLAQGADQDLWFVSRQGHAYLRRYRTRDDKWEVGQSDASSLAVDKEKLFLGQNSQSPNPDLFGVSILNFKDGKWKKLAKIPELPPGTVTALACDGRNLWVGGRGYVALVDPEQDKLLKFAHVQGETVDKIQIGGGYLWVQYDWHLHRVLLDALR